MSGFDFTTTAITINTRNKREFDELGITEAGFSYVVWTTEGIPYSAQTATTPQYTVLPGDVKDMGYAGDYIGHGREAGNAANSHGAVLFKAGSGDTVLIGEADIKETKANILVDWDGDGTVEANEQDEKRETDPGLILVKTDTTPVLLGFETLPRGAEFTLYLPEGQSLIKVKIDGVEKTGTQTGLKTSNVVTVQSANSAVGQTEITMESGGKRDRLVIWVVTDKIMIDPRLEYVAMGGEPETVRALQYDGETLVEVECDWKVLNEGGATGVKVNDRGMGEGYSDSSVEGAFEGGSDPSSSVGATQVYLRKKDSGEEPDDANGTAGNDELLVEFTVVKVEVFAIKFDHKGPDKNTSDALNMRKDASDDLDHAGNGVGDGEWLLDPPRNEPALYVANKSVTIKARFRVTPSGAQFKAKIKGCDDIVTWLNVAETEVSFTAPSGLSDYVEMPLVNKTPECICCVFRQIHWIMTEMAGFNVSAVLNSSGYHEIYVVLDVPQNPWYLSPQNEPWKTMLDVLTKPGDWFGGWDDKGDVVEEAIDSIWRNGYFTYETDHGAPTFSSGPNFGTFDLTAFVAMWDYSSVVETELNCADCAFGALIFASLMGCQAKAKELGSSFPLNCIDPIGDAEYTNNCFQTPLLDNDARQGGFGWHMVTEYSGKIYDACLRIDIDSNPDNVIEENPDPGRVEDDPQYEWHKPRGDAPTWYINHLVDAWVHPTAGRKNTPTSPNPPVWVNTYDVCDLE